MKVTVIRGGVELTITHGGVGERAAVRIERLEVPLESPTPSTLIIEDATEQETERMLVQAGDDEAGVILARDLIERTRQAYVESILAGSAVRKAVNKYLEGEE